MQVRRWILIGLGAVLILAAAAGFAFASDPAPDKEPEGSPFFDATLQQAVDELDGKVQASPALRAGQAKATQHYTSDPNVWPECDFGFTRDVAQWPWCHFTSDPNTHPQCDIPPWPTKDYTWDSSIWQECGSDITRDASAVWCDPLWTSDPSTGPRCDPAYTTDPAAPLWCHPRYTWDAAMWPTCPTEPPYYTDDPRRWIECSQDQFTTDPYRWAACHYTSDPMNPNCTEIRYPTQDYTSNPAIWKECDPQFTSNPSDPLCDDPTYTQDPMWPWCEEPHYTTNPIRWPLCHYTSDPKLWDECAEEYPTKDYTWDPDIWSECGSLTEDAYVWPWCGEIPYTQEPELWPWCNPGWTWDPERWEECEPGYTYDPDTWDECREGLYTQEPAAWPACNYYTAEARIWPECHFTSDPNSSKCVGNEFPTKDYTTDPTIWPECEAPPAYTTDPQTWPVCHYTSDPASWPECDPERPGDLGDAPDSTNHTGVAMTAFPAGGPPGVPANYPTVFDPATGFPPGPKHWQPRADAWLGPWVTLENDADLLPDEDVVTNLDPPGDVPDRDKADDGLMFPVAAPHCTSTVLTYTLTVAPGAPVADRYVNVWFDWLRDGDWDDVLECPDATLAPEWAVQNQVVALGPGTWVLNTPAYVPWNPTDVNIPETWLRISVAEYPAPTIPGSSLADGRGSPNGYQYGETEDYYFEPECPPPVADFYWEPPTICPTTTVQFWDTSTHGPTAWSWDFGDSSGTSTLQNPSYVYGAAGTYDVTLKVGNVCGTDTVTKRLVVDECPPQDPDYDIWIKDSGLDDGSVPSPSPWWMSPDIWVRNDGDCTQLTHQNPIPGATTTVCIRVRNRLTTTVNNITVNGYWANAAMGLSWPGSFNYIGTYNVGTLAGGAEKVDSVSWTVPYITGHFCLLGRIHAPVDHIDFGLDTMSPTDHPPNNNNIAQKNTNVVDFPEIPGCNFSSTETYSETVYFDAMNSVGAPTTVDIVFDSDDFPLDTGTLTVEPGDLWGRWTSLVNFDQSGETLLPTDFPATMGGIQMDPHETVRVTMTAEAEIDEWFTIRIEEQVQGTPVGGIEYVRRIPICGYLPVIFKNWPP